MTSKVRHGIKKYYMMSKLHHDIKKYVMNLKKYKIFISQFHSLYIS